MENDTPLIQGLLEPVHPEYINALIEYAAEHGNDPEGDHLPELITQIRKYETGQTDDKEGTYATIIKHYTALCAKTYPVNGRTLIETQRSSKVLNTLLAWTILLMLVATINGGLSNWYAEQPVPDDGIARFIYEFNGSFLDYLSPFIWGAIGACVYLMKRLYDIAQRQEFDSKRLRGWTLRILLGGILGAVVHELYAVTDIATGSTELSANAIAFFTGLGVKVVYGAFEKTVEVLAEKFDFNHIRSSKAQSHDSRTVLTNILNTIDPTKEPEKHRLLVEILKEEGKRE